MNLGAVPALLDACAFAARIHAGQQRKYTGEPYLLHCLEVAGLVAAAGGSQTMITVALLHDVVEDTAATLEDVRGKFGDEVAAGVASLTDASRAEDGNRAARKAIDREHLGRACADMQTVKLADVVSNTRSIVDHGDGFARTYLREMEALLSVLGHGHPQLLRMARDEVARGAAKWPS